MSLLGNSHGLTGYPSSTIWTFSLNLSTSSLSLPRIRLHARGSYWSWSSSPWSQQHCAVSHDVFLTTQLQGILSLSWICFSKKRSPLQSFQLISCASFCFRHAPSVWPWSMTIRPASFCSWRWILLGLCAERGTEKVVSSFESPFRLYPLTTFQSDPWHSHSVCAIQRRVEIHPSTFSLVSDFKTNILVVSTCTNFRWL